MTTTVVHSFPVWLPQTQTWLYQQIKSLPGTITPHVVCKETRNLDQFNVPNIHSLSGSASRLSSLTTRLFRQLDFHLYTRYQCGKLLPDVLHSHFGPVGWKNHHMLKTLPASKRRRIAHVVTFYGQDVDHLPKVNPAWRKRYKEMFRQVDLVLCEGGFMARKIRELGCPSDKVQVHRLGVDLQAITYKPRKKPDRQPFRILMAAAFRPKKGFIYGLQALDRVASDFDIEVTVVGDSTGDELSNREKNNIEQFVESSRLGNRVTFTGFLSQEQLNRLARDHHIFLAPSVTADDGDSEGGAPVSVIEMAASGMPVISSRHCDIPEVIPEGDGGLLADECDVDELTSHLSTLMSDPEEWSMMTNHTRAHIEEHYDAVKQGHHLAALYEKISRRTPSGKRKRLLFISHSGALYGAERSLLSLVAEIHKRNKYDVMVFLPGHGPLADMLQIKGIPYRIVPVTRWTGNRLRGIMKFVRGVKRRWHLPALVKEASLFQPDLIYTNTLATNAGALLKSRLPGDIPHIWHARELPEHPDFGFFDSGPEYSVHKLATLSDHIICNSRFLSGRISGLISRYQSERPLPPVRTVYNGFHFTGELPIRGQRKSDDSYRIVMIGSISPLKNYREAIEAVRLIALEGLPVKLEIVGGGASRDVRALKRTISAMRMQDNVVHHGYVRDTSSCLAGADLLLITSKIETFGRVAVEAMRAGCPVIASDVGGLPEVVRDKLTGLLYPSGDVSKLTDTIRRLLADPELKEKLVINAAKFVQSEFAMDRYITEIDRIIRETVSKSGQSEHSSEKTAAETGPSNSLH